MMTIESKLSWGLLVYPNLLIELPDILHCLDKGEPVYIDKISDISLRSYLKEIIQDIFELSKTSSSSSDSTKSTSISSLMKIYCHQMGITKKVNYLSNSEALAYRSGMPRLMHLLTELPELKTEIVMFLDNLIQQEGVDLSGLEDSNVREGLGTFLTSLGFTTNTYDDDEDNTNDDDVYSFPLDESKHEILKECLQHLKHAFTAANRFKSFDISHTHHHHPSSSEKTTKQKTNLQNEDDSMSSNEKCNDDRKDKERKKSRKNDDKKKKKEEKKERKHEKKRKRESSSSQQRSLSYGKQDKKNTKRDESDDSNSSCDSENEDDHHHRDVLPSSTTTNNNSNNNKNNADVIIGPSFPPSYINEARRKKKNNDDDDDDDDIGPSPYAASSSSSYPPPPSSSSSSSSSSVYAALMTDSNTDTTATANGGTSTTGSAVTVTAPLGGYIEPSGSSAVSHTGDGSSSGGAAEQWQREEWMTDVGENRILTGAFGATRTFQSGKLAKKAAAEYLAVKERHDAVVRTAAGITTTSTNPTTARDQQQQEEEEVRGPSLMQLHLQQVQSLTASSSGSNGNNDGNKRRPFDREKDVLQHKKMDKRQVADLAENAKELSSRFDRGSYQRGI